MSYLNDVVQRQNFFCLYELSSTAASYRYGKGKQAKQTMTTHTQTASTVGRGRKVNRPLALIVLSVWLAMMVDPSAFDVLVVSISEAYLAVATFVAATLLVFFSLERLFKFDLTEVLAGAGRLQVPLAAALGALPGCGGAIIVVTRYVSGKLSF